LGEDFAEGGVVVFCHEVAGSGGITDDVAVGVVDGEVGTIVADDELEAADTTSTLEGSAEVEAPRVI